jgi:type II secretory pathway pseudopilin PulG
MEPSNSWVVDLRVLILITFPIMIGLYAVVRELRNLQLVQMTSSQLKDYEERKKRERTVMGWIFAGSGILVAVLVIGSLVSLQVSEFFEKRAQVAAREAEQAAEQAEQVAAQAEQAAQQFASQARDPNASPEVLDELALSNKAAVRGYVAINPSTSSETLRVLSEDTDEKVLLNVASNSNSPQDVLTKLSKLSNARLRIEILNNPASGEELRTTIWKSALEREEMEFPRLISNTKEVPEEIIRMAASSTREDVIASIARLCGTPRDILQRIIQDENSRGDARFSADKNLRGNCMGEWATVK